MVNFCSKCGSAIDVNTGKCPKCNPVAEPASAWIPEEQAVLAKQENKTKGKGKTLFLTILFSSLLFITSILAIVVFSARNIVKEDNLEKIMSDADVDDVFEAFYKVTGEDVSFDDEASVLSDYAGMTITSEEFEEFLEDSDVLDFITKKLVTYVEDICENDDDFSIDERDIEEFILDNREELNGATKYDFTDEEIEAIAYRILDYDTMETYYPEEVRDENSGLFTVLRIILSYVTFAIALALSVVLIVALMKNNVSQGMKGAGIVLTIQGGLLTLFAMVALIIPDILGTISGNELLGLLGGKIISVNFLIFAVVLAIGVLFLVADKLMKKMKAKK